MNDDLSSLYDYDRWASARVIGSLRELSEEPYLREMGGGWPSIRATFVHLAGATWAWSERFAGRECARLPSVEEVPALENAIALLRTGHDAFEALLPTWTPERLAAPFTWRNLQGAERTAPFWAIARHVVNHGTYHRGQISSMVKRVGGKPLSTDMVFWGIERYGEGR